MESLKTYRKFLTTDYWTTQREGGYKTDQEKKLPLPAAQKGYSRDSVLIDLVELDQFGVGTIPLIDAIRMRRSRRKYSQQSLTLEELSFLLWATQGIQKRRKIYAGARGTLRTVPSGGARHPFETYLVINNVDTLKSGLYRYLPIENKLLYLRSGKSLSKKVAASCNNQNWIGKAALIFIWTAIPYRTEWRYSFIAAKTIAQESGHICQNLYLASEAIGAGTCAVGAYHQKELDNILGVDGEDELVVYIAPVGKI
ncbi:MAG: SagB/ThcOx family dehydrogenase [Candidatus Zixiibacteriota bacterium]|nr:MAG: SagB/ThcOx family dehydrogenase [candidate division Zixibacteria bacterium]